MDLALATPAGSDSDSAAESIEELLRQVKTEPAEDEEIAAKFSIYEGYSSQLEAIRKLLFEFHAESAPTVPAVLQSDWRRQLKGVDSAEAMSVPDDGGRVWFVYHMLKAAERNNRKMTRVLDDFRHKIDLLAKNDQTECPVCLEEQSQNDTCARRFPAQD